MLCSQRNYCRRKIIFRIDLPPNSLQHYYIHITSDGEVISLPLMLRTSESWWKEPRWKNSHIEFFTGFRLLPQSFICFSFLDSGNGHFFSTACMWFCSLTFGSVCIKVLLSRKYPRFVTSENSNILTIAVTADVMETTKQTVKDIGMNDYLSKPLKNKTLYAAVKALV